MFKKRYGVFWVFFLVLILILASCQQQQVSEEAETQEEAQSVSSLSGLRADNVAPALSAIERDNLKESFSGVRESDNKLSDDVNALVNIAIESRDPAVMDAALRIRRLYTSNTISFYVDELDDQLSEGVEETADNYLLELNVEIDELGAILEQMRSAAEESGNTLLLSHLDVMEQHLSELEQNTGDFSDDFETNLGPGDFDGDGIPDDIDTDPDGDGDNDDLNGDGRMTMEDADFNGDGVVNEDDFDLDGDGLYDWNGQPMSESDIQNDWNGDGLFDDDIEEIIDSVDRQNQLREIGFTDTNGDGLIDADEYDEQRPSIFPAPIQADINSEERQTELTDLGFTDSDGDGLISQEEYDGQRLEIFAVTLPDNDFDDDGIVDWEDSDADGSGTDDIEEFDDFAGGDFDGDGILNGEDDDINGDGVEDGLTFSGNLDDIYEHRDEVAENYGDFIDTDDDGIYDYDDDDIDGDGELNEDDDDANGNDVPDAIDYYNFERFIDTGLTFSPVENIPHEFIDAMRDSENPEDFKNFRETYLVTYQKDYASYLDDNPNLADDLSVEAKRLENINPEMTKKYEKFLIEHAEFGFGKEAAYFVENNPDVLNRRPEFFVVPDVAAHVESVREAYEAYLAGGVDSLPDGPEKDYLTAHPERAGTYESSVSGMLGRFDSHREEFRSSYSEEDRQRIFGEVFSLSEEDREGRYEAYFEHGGEIDSGAYEAYTSGGYVGGPYGEGFSVPEGFSPPEGYESYFSGGGSEGSYRFSGGGEGSGGYSGEGFGGGGYSGGEGGYSGGDSGGGHSGDGGGDGGGGGTGYTVAVRLRYRD